MSILLCIGSALIRRIFLVLAALGWMMLALAAQAQQPGGAAPAFVPGLGLAGHITQALAQPDGKLLILGSFPRKLVRLNPDGSLDASFRAALPKGYTGFTKAAVAPDGKIFVVGSPANPAKPDLLRLNADGSLDTGFQLQTRAKAGPLAPLADGGVVVSRAHRPRLSRYKADGSLDLSFAAPVFTSELGFIANVNAVALQADGKLLVGGQFNTVNGIGRRALVRLNPDGSVDKSFNAAVTGEGTVGVNLPAIDSILIQPNGGIVVIASGASVVSFHGIARPSVARLHGDGSLDENFNPALEQYSSVRSATLLPGGKVVIQGLFHPIQPNGDSRLTNLALLNADGSVAPGFIDDALADETLISLFSSPGDNGQLYFAAKEVFRLKEDGSVDPSFRFDVASGPNRSANTLVQPDGKIILYGKFTAFNGEPSAGLVRLNADGSREAGFEAALVKGFSASLATLQPDGKLLVQVGALNADGSTYDGSFARLNPDGSLDASFHLGGSAASPLYSINGIILLPSGKILLLGYLNTGLPASTIARYNADGSVDPTFHVPQPVINHPYLGIDSVAVQPDGRLIVTNYRDLIGVPSQPGFVRLLANGDLDASFNPFPAPASDDSFVNYSVSQVTLLPSGKILALGDFGHGVGLNRLLADGSVDPNFTIYSPSGTITEIALLPGGKLLVADTFYDSLESGSGMNLGGSPIGQITRLNADGSVDASFHFEGAPIGDFAGYQVTPQPDGKILLLPDQGNVTIAGSLSATPRYGLLRINADGSPDLSFDAAAVADGPVQTLTLLPDGKMLVGGDFTAIGGAESNHVARLNADGTADPTFVAGVGGDSSSVSPAVVGIVASAPEAIAQPLSRGKFVISRAGGDRSAPLKVRYAVKGSAVNGTDYKFLSGSAVIPAGADSVTLKVRPFGAEGASLDKKVKLALEPDAAYRVSLESQAIVKIAPDSP